MTGLASVLLTCQHSRESMKRLNVGLSCRLTAAFCGFGAEQAAEIISRRRALQQWDCTTALSSKCRQCNVDSQGTLVSKEMYNLCANPMRVGFVVDGDVVDTGRWAGHVSPPITIHWPVTHKCLTATGYYLSTMRRNTLKHFYDGQQQALHSHT